MASPRDLNPCYNRRKGVYKASRPYRGPQAAGFELFWSILEVVMVEV